MSQLSFNSIAILGGTFDPIHYAHLRIAQEVLNNFDIDKILFLPTGRPPHKKPYSSSIDRYNMTLLAINNNPYFNISDIELKINASIYTVDTLKKLKNLHPKTKFYFILGEDSLNDILNWKDIKTIFSYCTLIACSRNSNISNIPSKINIQKKNTSAQISLFEEIVPTKNINSDVNFPCSNFSSSVSFLEAKFNIKIHTLNMPFIDISSTQIRNTFAKNNSLKYILPDNVIDYIEKHNLYT